MKKLLYLFTASLLAFTSCSKDDNDSSKSESPILVSKRNFIGNDGSSEPENILYNGNKIISITDSDGYLTKFTYTGEQITKKEEIAVGGKLSYTYEYSYTSGRLASYIKKQTGAVYYYKTKYNSNADGTVSYEEFRINISTGVEEEYGRAGKYTFKDNNLIKDESSFYGTDNVTIYEYDTKYAPFKNVLGLNLLLDYISSASDFINANNEIKKTITTGSGSNLRTSTLFYTYIYDGNNFPSQKTVSFPSGSSTSTETYQYFYQK